MNRILLAVFLFIVFATQAQQSSQIITDKNFYIVTAINKTKTFTWLPASTKKSSNVADYRFTEEEINDLTSALALAYDQHTDVVRSLMTNDIRPSSNYILFHKLSDKDLWLKCWSLYFTGINYIVDQYGLGKPMRYPTIDSISYKPNSNYYKSVLSTMFVSIQPDMKKAKYFYENPLIVSMKLMMVNNRDEPARHEPLELGENKPAADAAKKTQFSQFKYSAIVVPGDGAPKYGLPLTPFNKIRLAVVAQRYREKTAPFIIVSGGYCHPFQTEFSEAVEMKKYLMKDFGIPESAIIIDPYARHTTTNFRNASRYIIRYKLPMDKPALVISTANQIDYIMNDGFDKRNIDELGYLPYKNKTRLSDMEVSFYPVMEALHRDSTDPLDP